MIENSSHLETRASLQSALGLPAALLPLSAFGDGGLFWSTTTDGVYEIDLGDTPQRVISGEAAPDWPNFEEFLRWFFELDD